MGGAMTHEDVGCHVLPTPYAPAAVHSLREEVEAEQWHLSGERLHARLAAQTPARCAQCACPWAH